MYCSAGIASRRDRSSHQLLRSDGPFIIDPRVPIVDIPQPSQVNYSASPSLHDSNKQAVTRLLTHSLTHSLTSSHTAHTTTFTSIAPTKLSFVGNWLNSSRSIVLFSATTWKWYRYGPCLLTGR